MKKSYLTLSIFLVILSSCAKLNASAPVSKHFEAVTSPLSRIAGKRIQELLVVIFKKDFSPIQWSKIFNDTRQISMNARAIVDLGARDDLSSNDQRLNLMGDNIDRLTRLSDLSAFLMSWSIGDENCKIQEDTLALNCSPFNSENSLNGGFPKFLTPIRFVIPNAAKDDIKTPYVEINLTQSNSRYASLYRMKLRLKVEEIGEKIVQLKGDVIPEAGSRLEGPDGNISDQNFHYGYAEMILVP